MKNLITVTPMKICICYSLEQVIVGLLYRLLANDLCRVSQVQHMSSNTVDEVKAYPTAFQVWLHHTWNAVGHSVLSVEAHE